MNNPMQQVPASVIIDGGVSVTVKHREEGVEERVRVPLISYRHAGKYLELCGDPAKLIEFACDKPEGYADKLSDDSFFELDAKIREINDPRIDRWLERQAAVVGLMKPKMARLSGQISSLPTQ